MLYGEPILSFSPIHFGIETFKGKFRQKYFWGNYTSKSSKRKNRFGLIFSFCPTFVAKKFFRQLKI